MRKGIEQISPENMPPDAHNIPYRTFHYHVHFKRGSAMTHVTVRELCGLQPSDVGRVWIVELRRRATSKEIMKLCKVIHEG